MEHRTSEQARAFLQLGTRPATLATTTREFGARNGVPGERLVRVTPTKGVGRDRRAV